MASRFGFIGTIEDDQEVENDDLDSEEDEILNKHQKGSCVFSDEFEFSAEGGSGETAGLGWRVNQEVLDMALRRHKVPFSSLDSKIARAREMRRLKFEESRNKKGSPGDMSAEESGSDEEAGSSGEDEKGGCQERGMWGAELKVQEEEVDGEDEVEGSDSEDVVESEDGDAESGDEREDFIRDKKSRKVPDSYFEEPPPQQAGINFTDMNISRPILKAVTSLGYVTPTPIQASTVPVALMGKDVCACAATGTGKTAAFFLPILERLLFRPSRIRVTRILVITPTRELAIQVHSVGRALARHMDIEFCLATGGLDSRSQEAALRKNPDIVIATPGRLVDHLHNAPSFSLSTIEILVLDEADKMLDDNFEDQMNEIIKLCPVKRQTMLFSATMTDKVEELVRLSLNRPVRLFVDGNTDVAQNLKQEFVRIKAKKEGDREAIITALCSRSFKEQCLVFLPTKKGAHRMRIIFGLLDLKAAELHGALSQLQRIESLKAFTEGDVDVLLATDLASRGLDIERVKTVINFSMPSSQKQYIHRVGRTARAGRSGRSVSLVGEKERKVLKEIVKQAKHPVKSRILPPEVVVRYRDKIRRLEAEIKAVLRQEEEEKQLRLSEMEVNKARNMVEHEAEILSRPARTWIQGKRGAGQDVLPHPPTKRTKKEEIRKKTFKKAETPEEKEALKLRLEQEYMVRVAKRSRKKAPATQGTDRPKKKGKGKVKKPAPVIQGFEKELTNTSKKSLKETKRAPAKVVKGSKFKSKKRYKRR